MVHGYIISEACTSDEVVPVIENIYRAVFSLTRLEGFQNLKSARTSSVTEWQVPIADNAVATIKRDWDEPYPDRRDLEGLDEINLKIASPEEFKPEEEKIWGSYKLTRTHVDDWDLRTMAWQKDNANTDRVLQDQGLASAPELAQYLGSAILLNNPAVATKHTADVKIKMETNKKTRADLFVFDESIIGPKTFSTEHGIDVTVLPLARHLSRVPIEYETSIYKGTPNSSWKMTAVMRGRKLTSGEAEVLTKQELLAISRIGNRIIESVNQTIKA
jgi:hypothetical protein